jgi:hypothetical protein
MMHVVPLCVHFKYVWKKEGVKMHKSGIFASIDGHIKLILYELIVV